MKKCDPKQLIDGSDGTGFQKKVWRVLLTIPRGEVRSYTWVAKKIGQPTAVRAVANACGANPFSPMVPCHRVVRSDGMLGGFTGGVKRKRKLLAQEGVIALLLR